MSSRYPAQIDSSITLPTVIDNFTPVTGSVANRLRDAIINIETELGVKPSGTSGTVRARVDQLDTTIANILDNAVIAGANPNVNDLLVWTGINWLPTNHITTEIAESNLARTSILEINNKQLFNAASSVPSVSAANQASVYYDSSQNGFRISKNGGQYTSLTSSGAAEYTVGPAGSNADYLCDGVDDQVEINAAITEASNSGAFSVVKLLPGTYYVNGTVFLKSNVILEGSGTGITKVEVVTGFSNSNYFVIGGYGTETTNVAMALTVNATYGELTLTVSPSAELNLVEVDSYLFLATDALWSPEQVPNSNRKGGEFVKVKSVDTGTGVITVHGMIRAAYNTTDNASLYRMSFIENTGVSNLEIYQQAPLTTRTSAPVMIGLQKGINCFIRNCHVHDSDGPGLSAHSLVNSEVRDNYVHDLTDNTGMSQFGYGLVLSGACDNLLVVDNRMSRMRHAVTTGSIATPSPANIILRGVQRGVLFSGNVGSHCTNTVFDTHAECENFAFINNLAQNSSGFGIFARNPSARVIANTVEWCQDGIKLGSNVFDVSSGQATGSSVVGNVIRNLKSLPPTNYCVGISLCLTEHCIVQDNVVSSVDGAGLELRFGSQFNIVRNNTFLNCNLDNNGSTLADAIYLEGAYSGSTAAFAQAGTTTTATGLTNMSPSVVGKKIVIDMATNPGNMGTFVITSYISSSSVTWENPSGVTDSVGNAIWHLESVCDNIIEGNLARNTGQALFEAGSDGAPGHMKWLVRVFGGTGQNVRNIIRNNVGIGMESGLVSAPAGNFVSGNSNNEAVPVKSNASIPVDTDFAATPVVGTIAANSSTGRLYFRTEASNTWGEFIHARAAAVSMPVQSLTWLNTVTNPSINQAINNSGAGNAMLISAQSSNVAAAAGGSLYLTAGNPGAGGTEGSVRLGIGSGNTGIQINPSLTGQSLYSVVAGATSVRFQQTTTATASATGAPYTIQAQSASGTTSVGGSLVLASGSGTTSGGSVRMAVGGNIVMVEATEVAAGRNVVSLARKSSITTTQMPTNSGDGVIYVGNAATVPTANPVSGAILYVDSGTMAVRDPGGFVNSIATDPTLNGFRLTALSGSPIATSDVASSSTIYLTPYMSGYISLYDGNGWMLRNSNEVSLSLSGLSSGFNYDVFAYWNGSAVVLELSAAWANDTTRTDALTLQNGIFVKSGTPTRRYVGTIRTTGTTTTADTGLRRYVWNFYNRRRRPLIRIETALNWAMANTVTSFRMANSNASNAVEWVMGQPDLVSIRISCVYRADAAGFGIQVGIGLDSTTTTIAQIHGALSNRDDIHTFGYGYTQASYEGYPTIGYHKANWLERNGGANFLMYSVIQIGPPDFGGSGILGFVEG